MHLTESKELRSFAFVLVEHCMLKPFGTQSLKGTPRHRVQVPVVMTHRKVRIRDKNAYLTLVPSESSHQADSYSMSHS